MFPSPWRKVITKISPVKLADGMAEWLRRHIATERICGGCARASSNLVSVVLFFFVSVLFASYFPFSFFDCLLD